MNPLTVFAEALRSLAKNQVRTGLSMLGIVIGVGAVIAMVAVGEGAKEQVRREIDAVGDDWIMIGFWGVQRSGVRRQGAVSSTETEKDAAAILEQCSLVRAATPSNRMSIQVVSSFGNYQTSCTGVNPDYFDIRRWGAAQGRLFTQEDMNMRARVACIGQTAAKELFGAVNPVGQTIRVNRITFEIIGVLTRKGMGGMGRDNDDVILFPWHVFQRQVAGTERSGTIFFAARHDVPLAEAKEQVRALLRQRHRLTDEMDDDFRLIDRSLSAQLNAEAAQSFNKLLMAIASISLIVGGVGIMNIMLVSVTERTREIGLRMAVGANSLHVLGQFLTEAIVLCMIGGVVGFFAGWGAAEFIAAKNGWETLVSYWMAAVAIAFSSAIGLFFGFYPAWRASRLDPIEALRYE
ncbi:MAG: ABC transporter permease [Planctomycetes bacterium]|nr:ABC transporter permease [Planctomycetota bacterium]